MSIMKDFLQKYTFEQKAEVLKEYKLFKESGVAEDNNLRKMTRELSDVIGSGFGNAFSMDDVAKEIALEIAYKSIEVSEKWYWCDIFTIREF